MGTFLMSPHGDIIKVARHTQKWWLPSESPTILDPIRAQRPRPQGHGLMLPNDQSDLRKLPPMCEITNPIANSATMRPFGEPHGLFARFVRGVRPDPFCFSGCILFRTNASFTSCR